MKAGMLGYVKRGKKFVPVGGFVADTKGRRPCKNCLKNMKHPLGGFCDRKCYDEYKRKT
jgi:hypothetical protein